MIFPLLFCAIHIFRYVIAFYQDFNSFQAIADVVNSHKTTWTADSSLPPHVTPSTFKRLLGARKPVGKLPRLRESALSDSELPTEFDSRTRWPRCSTIGHVQDQGTCASGWAIAAAGAFSDRLCIARNGSFRALLSSEELLACCDGFGQGCVAGSPEDAWEFFHVNGLVTGGDYKSGNGCQPYEIEPCDHSGRNEELPSCSSLPPRKAPRCIHRCTNRNYEGRFSKDHHKIVSGFNLFDDAKAIQKEIFARGPVEAFLYVFEDFPTYKSGIYTYVTGEYLGDHAVRLVGWGSENGTDYWIAANSWNTHWGEGGFFRIARGGNACGIESYITAGVPEA